MTTPNGAIKFNATSGSDTAASGLGPTPAQTGSGATTDGTAVVTGITTTGVSAGDLLWVQTASGRQFSIIASVDSGTQVTCDDTFALGTGQTWAIGGTRATFDNASSRRIFDADTVPGFIIETETNQNITGSAVAYSGSPSNTSPITVRGSDEASPVTIDQSAAAYTFVGGANTSGYWAWQNLKFTNSNASTTQTALIWRGGPNYFTNCEFGDATNVLAGAFQSSGGTTLGYCFDCSFHDLSDQPATLTPNTGRYFIYDRCVFHDNNIGVGIWGGGRITNCLIYNNTGNGINYPGAGLDFMLVENCVVYGNGGQGITMNSTDNFRILNNVIVGNGGYAINLSGIDNKVAIISNNAHYNNTSGFLNGTASDSIHANIALTADPFTDTATADFTINSDAGGGSTLRSTAITLGSTETRPFRWLDAAAAGVAAVFSYMANFTRLG